MNNRIQNTTEVLKKCDEYLVTCTGKLVIMNCYLPQQGRFWVDHRYTEAIDELIELADTLGNEYSFVLAGDFNSRGPNEHDFKRLIETLELHNASEHIADTFTYTHGKEKRILHSKLDHVLTRYIIQEDIASCEKTERFYKHGGHDVLDFRACIPEGLRKMECE